MYNTNVIILLILTNYFGDFFEITGLTICIVAVAAMRHDTGSCPCEAKSGRFRRSDRGRDFITVWNRD